MPSKSEIAQEFLDPKKLIRPIDEICQTAVPLEPLWGFFLYKKAITSIVADPGLGKTTLGYGLGMELAQGRPFLDIMPEEPVKVLYLDLESGDSLVMSRKMLVDPEELVPNFFVYNQVDFYFNQIATMLKEFCLANGINLVFIDNQTTAFNTRDENDNAEAAKQMRLLRMWVGDCNVALVIFHHTSKANLVGTRKGTGAFARARLADVCINLDYPDEEGAPDVIRWQMVKNRMVDERTLWYLKKVEGKLEFTEQPLGSPGTQTNTKIYKAQRAVLEFMLLSVEYKYSDVVLNCIKNGIGEDDVKKATQKLYQQGRLSKPRWGYWIRKQ